MAAYQSGNKNAKEHYCTSATTYVLVKCTVTNTCRGQQTYDNRHLLYDGSSPCSQTDHLSQDLQGVPDEQDERQVFSNQLRSTSWSNRRRRSTLMLLFKSFWMGKCSLIVVGLICDFFFQRDCQVKVICLFYSQKQLRGFLNGRDLRVGEKIKCLRLKTCIVNLKCETLCSKEQRDWYLRIKFSQRGWWKATIVFTHDKQEHLTCAAAFKK